MPVVPNDDERPWLGPVLSFGGHLYVRDRKLEEEIKQVVDLVDKEQLNEAIAKLAVLRQLYGHWSEFTYYETLTSFLEGE